MHKISDLPMTYQYFHKSVRQVFSQEDQDGVIEAVFDLIKTRNKIFVEIGGGNKYDNTYYLHNKKGWKGFLFNSEKYLYTDENLKKFYHKEEVFPDKALEVFKRYNVPKDLDFLSVDIDSSDFWVTRAILKEYRPALVSVEFNSNFLGSTSATIPNCWPSFTWKQDKLYGASARAINDMVEGYGYSYIYHMTMTDIFFIRTDLLPEKFRGMRLEETYDSFPIHKITLSIKLMLEKDIVKR